MNYKIDKNFLKSNIKLSKIFSSETGKIIYKQWTNIFKTNCINSNHEDKNPSLVINDTKKYYKCFSCWKYGDIFNIVIKYRKLNFPNALKYIEKNYLWENNDFKTEKINEIKKNKEDNFQDDKDFVKVMNYISKYWELELKEDIKSKYLLNKKEIQYKNFDWEIKVNWYWLNNKIIKKYKIWYSPNNSMLYKILKNKFSIDLIKKTSLFSSNWLPLFKNRITIPYIVEWNVRYFTSRSTEYTPINHYEIWKYKNQKINNKYYYNEDDLNNNYIFITEWVFDSLALKKIWYNSISLWWLFLKNNQKLINALKTSIVYILLDNDKNKAWNNKAIEIKKELKYNSINSYIITLPLEKNKSKIDINEYLCKNSKNQFNKLIKSY